jgi:hypothetical protein
MEINADTLMPSQWVDIHQSDNREASPLKRLHFAILTDAVRCLEGARRRKYGLVAREAHTWLFHPLDGPFSFDTTCAVLGIDAAWMRAGLREWLARGGQLEGCRRSPGLGQRIAENRRRHDKAVR